MERIGPKQDKVYPSLVYWGFQDKEGFLTLRGAIGVILTRTILCMSVISVFFYYIVFHYKLFNFH